MTRSLRALLLASAGFALLHIGSSAYAAPSAKPAALSYNKVWKPFWDFRLELPVGWKLQASGFQGPAGGGVEDVPARATKQLKDGAVVIEILSVYAGHPQYKSSADFIKQMREGKDAADATAEREQKVGDNVPNPGTRFESTDKKAGVRASYVVWVRPTNPEHFTVYQYRAPSGAFERFLPAFEHFLATFHYVGPQDAKPSKQ